MASVYHQLGVVATEQGRYDEAESYYRRALDSFLATGDERSVASVYHQLGVVAAEQRRYDEAERFYRMALRLSADMKDAAGEARTMSQLGALLTLSGRTLEAVRWSYAAFTRKSQLGLSEVETDLLWLSRQEQRLGADAFAAAAATSLGGGPPPGEPLQGDDARG